MYIHWISGTQGGVNGVGVVDTSTLKGCGGLWLSLCVVCFSAGVRAGGGHPRTHGSPEPQSPLAILDRKQPS